MSIVRRIVLPVVLLLMVPLLSYAAGSIGDRFTDLSDRELVIELPALALDDLPQWEQVEQTRDWILYACLYLLDVPVDSLLVHSAGRLPVREPMLAPLYSSQNGTTRWAWFDGTPNDGGVGDLVVVVPDEAQPEEVGLAVDNFRATTGQDPETVYVFTYDSPLDPDRGQVELRASRKMLGDEILTPIDLRTGGPSGYVEAPIEDLTDLAEFLRWADRLVHVRVEDGTLIAGGRSVYEGDGAITVDDVAALYEAYADGWEAGFSLDWRGCDDIYLQVFQMDALLLPEVNALALSPTEDLILVGRGDSAADLRPAAQMNPVTVLEHSESVLSVAFSPDGSCAATGGADGHALIWDISAGSPLLTLAHDDWIRSVAFSPDGSLLATGCDDGYTRLWRVDDGGLVSELEHYGWVYSVSFSPDGTLLATGCDDGYARLWRVENGELASLLDFFDWCVYSVSFSPDGSLLAAGCSDGVVRLWDVSTGDLRTSLEHPMSNLYSLFYSTPPDVASVVFSPDGSLLAAGDEDGFVHVWTIAEETPVASLTSSAGVTSVLFSEEAEHLLVGCADGTICTWTVPDGELLRTDWVWGTAVDREDWNWAIDSLLSADAGPVAELVEELGQAEGPNADHLYAMLQPRVLALHEDLETLLSVYCCQCARYDGRIEGTAAGMTWFYGDLLAKLWAIDWCSSTPEEEIGMVSVLDQPISFGAWWEGMSLPSTRMWFEPRYADWSRGDDELFFGSHGARIFAASGSGFGVETEPTPGAAGFIRWWESHWEDVEVYEPEFIRLGELEKWTTALAWLQGRGQLDLLSCLDAVSVDHSWRFDNWLTATGHVLNANLTLLEPDWNSTECIPLLLSESREGPGDTWRIQGGVSGGIWESLGEKTQDKDEFLALIHELLRNGHGSLASSTGAVFSFSSLSAEYGTCRTSIEEDVRLRTPASEITDAGSVFAELVRTPDGKLVLQSGLEAHASPDVPLSKVTFSLEERGHEIRIDVAIERGALPGLSDLASKLASADAVLAAALAEQFPSSELLELPDGSWLARHEAFGWIRIGSPDVVRGLSIVGESLTDPSTIAVSDLYDAEARCWQLLGRDVDVGEVADQLDGDEWQEAIETIVRPYLDEAGVDYTVTGDDILVFPDPDQVEPWFLEIPTDPVHRLLVFRAVAESGAAVAWVAEGSTVERARDAWRTARLLFDRRTTVFFSAGSEATESVLTTLRNKRLELQTQADGLGIPWTFVNLHEYSADEAAAMVRAALRDTSGNVILAAHRSDWDSFDLGNGGTIGLDWVESAPYGSSDRLVALIGCNSLLLGLNDVLVAPITGVVDFSLATGRAVTMANLCSELGSLLKEIGQRRQAGASDMPMRDVVELLRSLGFIAVDDVLITHT